MENNLTRYEKKQAEHNRSLAAVKSNELIQEIYSDMSLMDFKVFNFLVSKIQKSDKEFLPLQLDCKEFCITAGIDFTSGFNYKRIKETITNLASRFIWAYDSEKRIHRGIHIITDVTIYERTGKIDFSFHPDMKDYLLNLKSNFTKIQLIHTLPMKHKYSFRLYEILRSKKYKNNLKSFEIEYDVLDLKKMLGILPKEATEIRQGSKYYNYRAFHDRVLLPARDEIRLYTDLFVRFEPVRMGKTVVSIVFIVREKTEAEIEEAIARAEEKLSGQDNLYSMMIKRLRKEKEQESLYIDELEEV